MDIKLVKIGGSVISRKSSIDRFERSVVQRIARELTYFKKGLILIHGTGYVGKPPAIKYGYYQSGHAPKEDHLAMLVIKDELRLLNHKFIKAMLDESMPVIPYDVSHIFTTTMDCLKPGAEDELRTTLANGYVPVFYGDLIPCADGSFRVFSSDIITLLLSKVFKPKKVLFLSDVEGVYSTVNEHGTSASNHVLKVLNHKIARKLQPSKNDERDVSGGMSAKVACALEISSNSEKCLIGSGNVPGIIDGFMTDREVKGTYVESCYGMNSGA